MLKKHLFISLIFIFISSTVHAQNECKATGTWLQVLGSGGPELDDNRASSGYLIWHEGKARLLVDMGSGSLFHFEKSGASLSDLQGIMLSHMHVDHSNDLPSLIKASFFAGRNQDLLLFGPSGNRIMPSISQFVQRLFGENGAYKYLNSYISGRDNYRLIPQDINVKNVQEHVVLSNKDYTLTAIPVNHGSLPALAWKAEVGGKSIVFSGDMSNKNNVLATFAKNVDILVAHNAVPESARGIARNLHMPPSVIGQIAAQAKVKQLVISHRMKRTTGNEASTATHIRKSYKGPMEFADDLQCFEL